MSGIISAEPFMNYFPETLHNSTWQGFVTAIYEIGCMVIFPSLHTGRLI